MHLVILDGYTLNPGDLNWDALGKVAQITYYDRTSKAELASRLADADGALTTRFPFQPKSWRPVRDSSTSV
jgi:glycerate dehydrogenase